MKTTRHSLMAKGILVLLSLLVLVFAFTYTWFTDPDEPVTASGLSFTTESSGDFSYAVGFSTSQTGYAYKHTQFTNSAEDILDLEHLYPVNEADPVNLLYDYNPIDLTGNGVNLIRPAMNYGNWSINTASGNYSLAEENVQFISFDFIFRSDRANAAIKLDTKSSAKGRCETNSGDGSLTGASQGQSGVSTVVNGVYNHSYNYNALTSDNNQESNKYGRFSRDAIVGALRVAFLNYEANNGVTITANNIIEKDLVHDEYAHYSNTPALLWIPRPDIYLDNGAANILPDDSSGLPRDSTTTGWELDSDIGPSRTQVLASKAQCNAEYSTYEHQYYNIFEAQNPQNVGIVTYDDPCVVASVLDTNVASGDRVTLGNAYNIVTLNHYNSSDGLYYGKVRVRIWLEGTDSESRRALAGGQFSINFHLSG